MIDGLVTQLHYRAFDLRVSDEELEGLRVVIRSYRSCQSY
jgi:hypothetical protein